ncbi:MAG: PAS domain S-box protein, partial [Acidobacteria bacterium]|nr:PAS domain S-box protein [Acidobacteriota bacterium]
MLSSIADFVYIFDHDGRFVYANKALLHLWGLELKDVVGKNFSDLRYPEELAAKLDRQIQQVFETKQPLSDKTPYTSPTGVSGFYEYIFAPVLGADGSVEFVSGSTRNLTDLHYTLDALQHSEERLRRVVEASGIGTWELDVDTGRITGDARFFALMELPHGIPLTLESAIAALHVEDRACVSHAVAAALAGENEGRYSVEHRTIGLGDAPARWVEARGQVLFDACGTAVSLTGTGVDITERKQSEQALKESEARFRQLADTVPQMVWVTRPDGFHEYYNRRWYDFTGVPEGSTDGEGWNRMFHPDDQEMAWARWRHSLATGEPYEIEYRLHHHSGEYRWTLGRALPIRNNRGEIERWFGTCTDIDA